MVWQFWTRTHQAHIAAQDVVKLREFIQFKATQEFTDGRDSRIAFGSVAGSDGFRIFYHRAEFIDSKQLALSAGTLLAENDGSGRSQTDCKGHDAEQGRDKNQRRDHASEIENAFPARDTPGTYAITFCLFERSIID